MKRLLLPLVLVTILFSGCERVPFADFLASSTAVQPGDIITFHNNSTHASSYEWDFGDGYASTNYSPSHYYDKEGTYTVTLTASGNGHVSVAHVTIDVYYTVLEVTVAEWNQDLVHNHLIAGATVILYPTFDDWDGQSRPIVSGTTDKYGIVDFMGLDPDYYYIDAYSDLYDNWSLAYEDVGWIEAGPLVPFAINQFTAWVDYDPAKSASRSGKKLVSAKINTTKRTYIKVDVSK